MRDGSTRILHEVNRDPRLAKVVDPSTLANAKPVASGSKAADYLGYAFLVRPSVIADAHIAAAGDTPRQHWFWSVVSRFWPNYVHVATAALLVNILALASPLFIMNVYDRVVPNGAIASLVALSIGLLIAVVFDFVLRTVRSRIIDMTGKKLDVVLASNIFEHTLAVKMNKRPGSVGVLANQLRDFDSVREFFTSGSVVSATDLIFALLFVFVLFMIAGPLAWIPLSILPIMIVIGLIIQRPLDTRHEAVAVGIGGAPWRSDRVSDRHRDRARNRRRSTDADGLGAIGRRRRANRRGRSFLGVIRTEQREHRSAIDDAC